MVADKTRNRAGPDPTAWGYDIAMPVPLPPFTPQHANFIMLPFVAGTTRCLTFEKKGACGTQGVTVRVLPFCAEG
eukprot:COSAG01_NODE_49564_length_371_cov_0.709559_1_plen_74_part_10